MMDDRQLNEWFCREVLPLERSLTTFIRRNWKVMSDVPDLRQEIYERVLIGARRELPGRTAPYLFITARHHLINRAKRAKVISFDLVADLETIVIDADMLTPERHANAREELKRTREGIDRLPPRCREVLLLRKLENLSTREVAERLGVGIDTVEQQTVYGMRALVDFMRGGSGKIQRTGLRSSSRRERSR